jgi:hypothetical protein
MAQSRTYRCEICGQSFNSEDQLDSHNESQHGVSASDRDRSSGSSDGDSGRTRSDTETESDLP